MKTAKVSFDFTDRPEVAETLRVYSAHSGKSQKTIVVEALEAYFANQLDNAILMSTANRVFQEWDNPEDAIYDSL